MQKFEFCPQWLSMHKNLFCNCLSLSNAYKNAHVEQGATKHETTMHGITTNVMTIHGATQNVYHANT